MNNLDLILFNITQLFSLEAVQDQEKFEFIRTTKINLAVHLERDQDGRVVKALDLSSNGRVVRVGSNPTPGKFFAHDIKIVLKPWPLGFIVTQQTGQNVTIMCKNWKRFTVSSKNINRTKIVATVAKFSVLLDHYPVIP